MRPFLWGASTSPHQTEGNNLNSDWWELENAEQSFLPERSGDAVDSYHRYREEMTLLSEAGLNAYRFGVEWARIEPEQGRFSAAALAHYRRMIDTALELGLAPVVTLHHFSNPRWFAADGAWGRPDAVALFARYVERLSPILDGVEWVCTINEPNMVAIMGGVQKLLSDQGGLEKLAQGMPAPDEKIGGVLVEAHRTAVQVLRERTTAAVGWSIAQQAFTAATPEDEDALRRTNWIWEDLYLEASRGDDFVGTQSYTSQLVGRDGPVPHPPAPDDTITGWAYRPDALGMAVRHAWEVTGGVPVLVTENGIATEDDQRRIAYTEAALGHLWDAMTDGVDVRGYLHWSAVDNYEWGHWGPTFGLISVDRETFVRTPKPSLAWLGGVARRGRP